MRAGLLIVLGFAVGLMAPAPLAASPEKAEALFREAQEHFAEGRFAEALERYQAAYDLAPLPDIRFNIAQSHRNLGNYGDAATEFRRFLRERPGAPNAAAVRRAIEQLEILIEATQHFRQRRYERALESYRRAQKSEALPTIHRDLGRTLERLGRYDEAIAAYRSYLEARPVAADRADIEETIARLEGDINGAPPAAPPAEGSAPLYGKWWFWAGVAAVLVAGGVTAVAVDGRPPSSDLGNLGFER